ncbi:SCO family protein [Peribacillus asahii]|uniref:SCO family protein n=1 Tax=Peribacillus asahii TaxID=228899 RepID=A0A398BG84_9BACI|nr:SCO family protein [Peribacillus asahii]RID89112.1 SCO family protein [Peribacillus asahii]
MRRQQLFIMLGIVLLTLSACSSNEIPNEQDRDIEDFSFTTQEGKKLEKSDLKGKVWVADFIFTSCETVCFPMTSNMVKLQKMLKDEGIKDVEFVSFSVDPEVDKPDVLKKYADQFDVDYSNWHFLTGYQQDEIIQFAKTGFGTLAVKPKGEDQVIHGTSFYLLNQEGKIVQEYTGLEDIPFEDIIEHIKIVQSR